MGELTLLYELAKQAGVDIRTAKKARRLGAEAVRGRTGERVAAVAAMMGIQLGVERGANT